MKPNQHITYEPYWWAHAKPFLIKEKDWQSKADAVIVGSGYTGLSAALTLLDANLKVVIIDSEMPGYGASSRNGGITSGKIKPSLRVLTKRFGSKLAKLLIKEGNTARQDLYNFIKNENIECDLENNGMLVGATSQKAFDNQKREAEELFESVGSKTDIVEKQDIQNFINSPKYIGGSFDKDIGSIHPAKLVSSMTKLVSKKKWIYFQ